MPRHLRTPKVFNVWFGVALGCICLLFVGVLVWATAHSPRIVLDKWVLTIFYAANSVLAVIGVTLLCMVLSILGLLADKALGVQVDKLAALLKQDNLDPDKYLTELRSTVQK
eukprot:3935042-Rhodomonas_salina.2